MCAGISRIITVIHRIVCHAVVVTGDHHYWTFKSGELLGGKVQTGLLDPVVVKQVASQQKNVDIMLDGFINNRCKTLLTRTGIRTKAYIVIKVDIRGVQNF